MFGDDRTGYAYKISIWGCSRISHEGKHIVLNEIDTSSEIKFDSW